MNKKVIITFPICIRELFFNHLEDLKKTKGKQKLPGYEMVSLLRKENNLEIKIPVHITGLHYNKQPFFVFLLPKRVFGNDYKKKPEKFFQKGLCRIEGTTHFSKHTVLIFEGNYQDTSLEGLIHYYYPPHFGWD